MKYKIFILLFLYQQISQKLCLPQNFTSIFQVEVLIDAKYRGNLQFGLYKSIAPKATFDILRNCNNDQLSNYLTNNQGAPKNQNNDQKDNNLQQLNKLHVDTIQQNQFMQFGVKNKTYEQKTYYSEINDLHTEFGALAQQREESNGQVGARYTVLFKRAEYDGKHSLWHVFGTLTKGHELLKFINEIASENDGLPNRKVQLGKCDIIKV